MSARGRSGSLTGPATYPLRVSTLSEAQKCPLRYWVQYVLGHEPENDQSYFKLGHIIHEGQEKAVENDLMFDPVEYSIEDQTAFLEAIFRERWSTHFSPSFLEALEEYYTEHTKAKEATDAHGIEANGKPYIAHEMTTFWKKNHKKHIDALEAKVNKLAKKFKVTFHHSPTDTYRQGRDCLKSVVKLQRELIWRHGKPVKVITEHKIDPPVDFEGFPLTGTLDRLDIFESGLILLSDYKTGRSKKWATEDIINSDQLFHYAYAAEQLFGILPTMIAIWDLFNGNLVQVDFDTTDYLRWKLRTRHNAVYFQGVNDVLSKIPTEEILEGNVGGLLVPNFGGGCKSCPLYVEKRCPFYRFVEEGE